MRALLPALALLAAALAGCTAEPPATEGLEQPPPSGAGASGGSAPQPTSRNATANASATDPDAWLRAQWGEAAERVLVDESVQMQNTVDTSVWGCINCQNAFFIPGELVLPGSAAVTITATYTPPPTAPSMQLTMFYRTAADEPVASTVLASDQPFDVPVTPENADAPFTPGSLWWFFLTAQADPAGIITGFDMRFRAVAARAPGPLPEMGPAPDPWNGQASARLTSLEGEESGLFFPPPLGFFCISCQTGWDSQGPALVAPGAASLAATLSWNWPGTAKPRLHYFNALTFGGAPMELAEDGASQRTYTLPVSPEHWDSPWQRRSHWGFFVDFEGEAGAGLLQGRLAIEVEVLRGAGSAQAPQGL